jgi:DNA mismatch endonuclease Vsr
LGDEHVANIVGHDQMVFGFGSFRIADGASPGHNAAMSTVPKNEHSSDAPVSEQRSRNMRAISAFDTKPEVAVRRLLHRLGYRFRLHRADLPGRPDIVLPKYRLAVFVHGCFWHRHEGCHRATLPKTRSEFWSMKLSGNVVRDRRSVAALEAMGWCVATIWECETRDVGLIETRIAECIETRP